MGQNTLSVKFEINIVKVRAKTFFFPFILLSLVMILIYFLGPMAAVTWNPIPPCGRRRMAAPDARTSSSDGAER